VAETRRDAEELRHDTPLSRVLGQVERQMSHLLEPILATDGLTVDQWRVLDLLADGAGHTMSDIASTIVVPGPTLTKLVDRLVDAAAVYRLVDVRDRRRVLAFISESGRAVHGRIAPRVAAAEASALSAVGVDAPALLELLGRLAAGPATPPPG
jgi:DNA-binding MarR family transcriptional regulator